MDVVLAVWAPIISPVWYVCWSLDSCQMEALKLLYASYVLSLLLHPLQLAALAAVTDWEDSGLDSRGEGR